MGTVVTPTRHRMTVEERDRSYWLYRPAGIADGERRPLVIALHAHGGTGRNMMRLTRLNDLADAHGFLVAYPDGTGWLGIPWRSWNAGSCCGYAVQRQVDDVQFIHVLLKQLIQTQPVAAGQVYVTGVSNGGMMVYRLGCELSGSLAGIGVVAGAFDRTSCQPAHPVPVMIIHGMQDEVVPYGGGRSSASDFQRDDASVAEAVAFWIERNRCITPPDTTQQLGVRRETYSHHGDGADVSLYTLLTVGHRWPKEANGFSASRTLWEFFSRQRRTH